MTPRKGVEFHRGYEAGWHVANVYGRHPNGVLKFNLCRCMDNPDLWEIEAKPMYGFPDDREDVVEELIETHELSGPYGSLGEAKQMLSEAMAQVPYIGEQE